VILFIDLGYFIGLMSWNEYNWCICVSRRCQVEIVIKPMFAEI